MLSPHTGSTTHGSSTEPTQPGSIGLKLGLRPMRYLYAYLAFVVVSAMDIILTWNILIAGGIETNPVAALIIEHHGLTGMIAYKFALTTLVIVICEVIGRKRHRTGMRLAWFAVALSSIPIWVSLSIMLRS